jgi:hypothetical protein
MPYVDPEKRREAMRRHDAKRRLDPARQEYKRSNQAARRAERRDIVFRLIHRYKRMVGCERCGITDTRVLDLHHRDSSTVTRRNGKRVSIAQMAYNFSLTQVKNEIRECDVLCANCHRITEWEKQ